MAWNLERSKERIAAERKRVEAAGVVVRPLAREMDLTNLSPINARLVSGVHLYADLTNLDEILLDPVQSRDDYRRVYRTLHLTRRELRRILQSVFCGDKIQVQGGKFHGLLFRPYGDSAAMARYAILASLAMYSALTEAFGEVFEAYPRLIPAIGIEYGDCLVANIGIRGDRELIAVGNAANRAAKILVGGGNAITIGSNLHDSLDAEEQKWFTATGEAYCLDCGSIDDIEAIVRDAGFDWSVQSSITRFTEDKESLPLDDISIEDARARVDVTRLGPTCAKTVPGASLFVDIDGYTALVDSLDGDTDELAKAMEVLHLLRYELRQVTEMDHDGVALQHQGDRLQGLLHLPAADDAEVMESAVELCIACNSSVEDVLNSRHADLLGKLHVAIGCAFGKALVGMLGTKGDRDPVCIGKATMTAENIQLAMAGNHLGITKPVYESIGDDEIKCHLTWDGDAKCYAASGLTLTAIEQAEAAKQYATAKSAAYGGTGAIVIGSHAAEHAPLKVTRAYSS
jgi:class 3 adenylate cyclase